MPFDLQFNVSRADWFGIVIAALGLVAAFAGHGPYNWKFIAGAILLFVIGVGIIFWPSRNHESKIDFIPQLSPASRCVELYVKAPDVKGMSLWLSQSENETTWILRPVIRRQVQEDGRYLWSQRLTLGPPKAPAGVQYRVYAFYLPSAESDFLQGIKGRAPSDSSRAASGDPYWTSQRLPVGAPSKPPLQTITRRNNDSPEKSC
jgi:hypothetical protein